MEKSKFTVQPEIKVSNVPVRKSMTKPEPVPEPRKERKARAYRAFTYRGIAFFLVTRGENTVVYILNKDTNTARPCIEVPRRQALKAAQALAKITLTEQYLDNLQVSNPSGEAHKPLHLETNA